MVRGMVRRSIVAVGLAAFVAFGVPAAAQNYSDGYRFLQAVKDRKNSEVDELLAKPGSQTLLNSRDLTTNRTALHIVVERRDVAWINFLVRRGADPNIADREGVTPLMRACQIGFVEGVQALIAGRARVDDANDAGETPLILAVHRRDTAMMRALLKAGASPDRTDNSGRSARDYAKEDGANSLTLAEIERSQTADRGSTAGRVYGPGL